MKAKKAVKRLNKVEGLLTDVMERYDGNTHDVKDLLVHARESIVRAKETATQEAHSKGAARDTSAKGSKHRLVTTDSRERTPLASEAAASGRAQGQ